MRRAPPGSSFSENLVGIGEELLPPTAKIYMATDGRNRRNDNSSGGQKGDTTEKVVFINRCAKVVKGGRRFSFSALIVTGDKQGKVGCGFGKANEVSEAIRKASESAKKSMVKISVRDNTIPHEVIGEHGGGRVLLRPASPGTRLTPL